MATTGLFNGYDFVVTNFDQVENLVDITITRADGVEVNKTVSLAVLQFPVGTKVKYRDTSFVVSKQMNKKVELSSGQKVMPSSLVLDN